ncbi:MAG: trigger factor [Elusimicrobia bacterium]|nr:trigger factor [Elusimicrobiota bacterium]
MAFWTPSDKPKVKKVKEEGCKVTLAIEVPPNKAEEAIHNAFIQIQARAALPGFRPGKAPLPLIQQQFAEQARQKAFDQLIQQVIPQAFQELSVQPVSIPTIHSVAWLAGKPLSFQVDVECPPKFKIKEYKKISLHKKEHIPSEMDLEQRLKEIQESNARLEISSSEQVSKDHFVVVDYEGTLDSKPIEGGKGESELIDMSSPQTIAGLAEGILNAKRGETREIPVDMQGKKAIFKVTVKEIKSKKVPALDAEFCKDLGFESLEALKKKIKEVMEQEAKEKAKQEVRRQIEEHLLQHNTLPVPPSLVEAQQGQLLKRLKNQLGNRDIPEKDLENLKNRLKNQAEKEIRLSYILRAISDEEKIQPGDEDFQNELNTNLQKVSAEDQKGQIQNFFKEHKSEVLAMIRERKVMEYLEANAKII